MTKAKTNNPRFSTAFRKASLEERFHRSYVKVESGCWEWVGTTSGERNGYYGVIRSNRIALLAHRVSWELLHGPTNLCVLHKCDNRRCVNPDHLFVGTRIDNTADRHKKGRSVRGEQSGRSKLKELEVVEIREHYRAERFNQVELALLYNVTHSAIGGIVRNKYWKHVKEQTNERSSNE